MFKIFVNMGFHCVQVCIGCKKKVLKCKLMMYSDFHYFNASTQEKIYKPFLDLSIKDSDEMFLMYFIQGPTRNAI